MIVELVVSSCPVAFANDMHLKLNLPQSECELPSILNGSRLLNCYKDTIICSLQVTMPAPTWPPVWNWYTTLPSPPDGEFQQAEAPET